MDDPYQGHSDGAITVAGAVEGLPADLRFTGISAGGGQSAAVDQNGQVWAWGLTDYGYLNAAWNPIVLTEMVGGFPTGAAITMVSVGHGQFLALASDGTLYAWGANNKGQLGDGTKTSRGQPAPVTGFPTGIHATSVCAGYNVSFATGSDGNLYAWGDNTGGLLGTGAAPEQLTPKAIGGFPAGVHVVAAATGGHTMAFQSDKTNPVIISGAANTLALGSDGKVYGWGANAHGELGDGTTQPRTSPTLASALHGLFPVSAISVGAPILSLARLPRFLKVSISLSARSRVTDTPVDCSRRSPSCKSTLRPVRWTPPSTVWSRSR
jgi:alpha-tubulin suppressor-like RCC1 family protein